ncbi:putative Hepatocellular carcinomaassociated antigen 59 [Balamuthia mandrillaris]
MEEPGVVPVEANGNEKGAAGTVVTFRKKSKKKAVRLRQKQQNDVGVAAAEKEQADTKQTRATREEEEEEEEEDLSQLLRETKRIHKDRTRIRGCEADATSEVVLSAIAEKGVMYPVTDGEGEGYMNSTFTVQKEAEGSQTIDPMLEKYIQEGLMEFRMKKARESLERTLQEKGMTLEKVIADKKQLQEERKKNEGEGRAKTEVMIEEEQIDMLMLKEAERRLYEIPEHLRVEEKPRSDDTISESWLTGIQEVELPMEYVSLSLSLSLLNLTFVCGMCKGSS